MAGRKIPWRVSPSSGSWSLQPTLWGVGTTGPRPSGWGTFWRGGPPSAQAECTPDLRRCLPPFVADTIAGALPLLGQKLRGYDDPDAVLTAVESRSSSPVRIPRDGTCQSSLRGLYPCGEGAGYAGGILSAAADGMHCAEQLCQSIQKESDCL